LHNLTFQGLIKADETSYFDDVSLARLSQLGMRAGGKGRGIKGWAVEGLHYMAGCGC